LITLILMLVEILFCYLLQSSVFPMLQLAGVVPDLLLIVVISTAYLKGQVPGMICGLLAGLLNDFMYGNSVGLYAMIYLLIGFLCGYANRLYRKEFFFLPVILVAAGELVYGTFYYIFEFLLRGRMNYSYYLKEIIIPRTIYTVLATVLFFGLFQGIHLGVQRLEKKEE